LISKGEGGIFEEKEEEEEEQEIKPLKRKEFRPQGGEKVCIFLSFQQEKQEQILLHCEYKGKYPK